jgi:hypothetical protein
LAIVPAVIQDQTPIKFGGRDDDPVPRSPVSVLREKRNRGSSPPAREPHFARWPGQEADGVLAEVAFHYITFGQQCLRGVLAVQKRNLIWS